MRDATSSVRQHYGFSVDDELHEPRGTKSALRFARTQAKLPSRPDSWENEMSHGSRKQSGAAVTVEIECLTCHAQKSVELSPEKFKELSQSWKVRESCDNCNEVTEWSFAQAAVDKTEQEDFWDWMAATGEFFQPEGEAQQDERRKERRIDVHVLLHISASDGVEEEVTSENISKSGFCFSSARVYELGKTVRVTLQIPGALDPITKMATIVRAGTGADDKYVYGVRLES
jgi:hypothetical protein